MDQMGIGKLVLEKRRELGLTQEELAQRCGLDTRTVQRIEKGEVKPYFSTLKTLSAILDCDLISEVNAKPWTFSQEETEQYRNQFRRRRGIRIAIMVIALILLLGVATLFPGFRLFGLSKLQWAPYFYLIMFGLLIGIGLVWRCPACGASLGSPFNTRYCSRCGFDFKKEG
jgi:transcriptional regulator with XRE-family HTH domain